jgi:DMSO/TMAO reductase YedYZ molybdopterin-dependent catalytic subunit
MDILFGRPSKALALGALCCGIAIAADSALVVSGVSSAPLNLTLGDLAQMPRAKAAVKDHTYEGVLISALLKRAGMTLDTGMRGPLLAVCVVAEAHDGYRALFSLPELDPAFTTGMVMVADHMDGKPLAERDGPLKIVVPGDKRADRWVRGVERLRVTRVEGNGARLSGAIETGAGKSPDKLQIELRASNSDAAIATSTEKTFQFPDLPPGVYSLQVTAPGFDSLTIESIAIVAGQKVELPPVRLSSATFGPVTHMSLRLNGTSVGSLSGRVVGDGAAPLEGAHVNLMGPTSAAVVTDSSGEYAFPSLAAGSYALQVERKDFFPEIQSRLLVQLGYDSISPEVSMERCLDPLCSNRTKLRRPRRSPRGL